MSCITNPKPTHAEIQTWGDLAYISATERDMLLKKTKKAINNAILAIRKQKEVNRLREIKKRGW